MHIHLFYTGKIFYSKLIKTNYTFRVIRHNSNSSRRLSFNQINAQRKAEAQRSIVIQISSTSSFNDLYSYCSKYGNITDIHHFKNSQNDEYMLVEFNTEDNLKNVLQCCSCYHELNNNMPIESPFFWFKREIPNKAVETLANIPKCLAIIDGSRCIDNNNLVTKLQNCDSVSDQIQFLYDTTKLNDINIRLRYVVARQLEMLFENLYSNICIQPFGSSTDGFGEMACSLYMTLINETKECKSETRKLVYPKEKKVSTSRDLRVIGDILSLIAPGVTGTRVHADHVKYHHFLTDLGCELYYNYKLGLHMSELFFIYSTLDPRVCPLTFAVREWGKNVGLPYSKYDEFSLYNYLILNLMVFFFLQQDGSRVLPSFNDLLHHTNKYDETSELFDLYCCSPNPKQPTIQWEQNQDSLETLLCKFFEFYSVFDFENRGLSVVQGESVRKSDASSLLIVNPFHRNKNISENVTRKSLKTLRIELQNAAWNLEKSNTKHESQNWGLLNIIKKTDKKRSNVSFLRH